MPAITQADRVRLQAHLRRVLRSPSITLDPPETQGGTAQVRIGENVLGTVDLVDDEGGAVLGGDAGRARGRSEGVKR